jgi:hypothetical protein
VGPNAGTLEQYAEEIGALWTGLSRTLGRLDRFAGDSERLEDVNAEPALRHLQYSLHLASEHAFGVEPPAGAETAHAELAAALAAARDATAEVAETIADWGADATYPLLPEWRGSLFRVRLARLRLALPAAERPREQPPADDEGIARPLIAFLLALVGALAFVAGAVLGDWQVWAAGLLAVSSSVLAYRP